MHVQTNSKHRQSTDQPIQHCGFRLAVVAQNRNKMIQRYACTNNKHHQSNQAVTQRHVDEPDSIRTGLAPPPPTNKNVNKNIFFLILKYFILNLIIFVVVATLVLSEV